METLRDERPLKHSVAGRFAGKVVMLFGGGQSEEGTTLGSAAAIAYAREGAEVVVVDFDDDAARRTAAIIAEEGNTAITLRADVRDEDAVARSIMDTVNERGRIDVLHNNVGSTLMGLPPELSLDAWNRSLHLNLGSVFLSVKHVLPVMVAQGSGCIINISSVASLRSTGYPYPAYSAAKAAVNQLTGTLAIEYARAGVRINAIAPGVISSPLMYREISGQYSSVDEMIRSRDEWTPRGRSGTPWDVAEASLFLASDAAAFITGIVLPVDGGQHLKMG